jgi:hypothetical protein
MPSTIDPHDPALRRHASEVVTRAAAVVGLAGIAVIHLIDSIGKFHETPYLGWMYIGLIVACLGAAGALVRWHVREAWLVAIALPAAAIVGYVLTRTTGLPQAKDDIGNWTEPLGLAALFTEGVVIAIAGYALTALEPVRAQARRGWRGDALSA